MWFLVKCKEYLPCDGISILEIDSIIKGHNREYRDVNTSWNMYNGQFVNKYEEGHSLPIFGKQEFTSEEY